MKKILLKLTIILFTCNIYCQKFSISELIKINNYSLDDFDTSVTQKGFKYFKNNDSEFSSNTYYALYINGSIKEYINKYYYKHNKKEMIAYQTGDVNAYLNLKKELKILKFTFIETNTFDGRTFFRYKKGSIIVSLASNVQITNYGDKVNSYEISITK